ncbi:S1C family serine protease [Marinomonas epiphytica]
MTIKTHWLWLIIAALLGICIGLAALLIQTFHQNQTRGYSYSVNKAIPAVVSIYTEVSEKDELIGNQGSYSINLGSGVIIDSQGYILTNHHVIQNSTSITVRLYDDRHLDAKLVGSDPATDLAVLKIDSRKLPHIELGDSQSLVVGDQILAIGNPYDIGQTVTAGIISAKGRNSIGLNTYENFLQTDAAINPGNSGGALVNLQGQLVGISSAIYSSTTGSQGIGFATPVNDAIKIMKELIQNGHIERGYLGMEVQSITALQERNQHALHSKGLLVSQVFPNSPAQKAGFKVGDIIIKVNNINSKDPNKMKSYITSMKPGSIISIVGSRGSQSFMADITLAPQFNN